MGDTLMSSENTYLSDSDREAISLSRFIGKTSLASNYLAEAVVCLRKAGTSCPTCGQEAFNPFRSYSDHTQTRITAGCVDAFHTNSLMIPQRAGGLSWAWHFRPEGTKLLLEELKRLRKAKSTEAR